MLDDYCDGLTIGMDFGLPPLEEDQLVAVIGGEMQGEVLPWLFEFPSGSCVEQVLYVPDVDKKVRVKTKHILSLHELLQMKNKFKDNSLSYHEILAMWDKAFAEGKA